MLSIPYHRSVSMAPRRTSTGQSVGHSSSICQTPRTSRVQCKHIDEKQHHTSPRPSAFYRSPIPMTDLEQGPPRDHREIPSSRQKQAGETDTTGRQAMDDTVSVEVLSTLFIMQSNRPFNLLSSPLLSVPSPPPLEACWSPERGLQHRQ